VRLSDLTPDDVRSYLPLTTRKTRSGTTATKWDPVLDRAYYSPDFSALAAMLSTPLMVALARAIFSDTEADPADLLKCASAAELEDHLLEGFVPAVYSRFRHDNLPCSAENAQRYLGFLASHLQRLGTYDLAWWELVTAVPRIVIGLVSGLVITLAVWLGAGILIVLGTWTDDARTAWLTASTVAAVACGVAGGIVIGLGLRLRYPSPAKIQLRAATRLSRFGQDFAFEWRSGRVMLWFLMWSFVGAIFGFAATRIWRQLNKIRCAARGPDSVRPGHGTCHRLDEVRSCLISAILDSKNGIVVGLAAGFFTGFGINLVTTIVRVLTVPVEPTETISPAELIVIDRAAALRQGIIIGIGGATVLWLTSWLGFEAALEISFETVFPPGVWQFGWLLAAGSSALLWILCTKVWGLWLIARIWLSLTGRLPWPVMTFLADAHRRGILRQSGGFYQFRHARLQNHLDRQTKDKSKPSPSMRDSGCIHGKSIQQHDSQSPCED